MLTRQYFLWHNQGAWSAIIVGGRGCMVVAQFVKGDDDDVSEPAAI
jgi:hypothetical protein